MHENKADYELMPKVPPSTLTLPAKDNTPTRVCLVEDLDDNLNDHSIIITRVPYTLHHIFFALFGEGTQHR